MQERMSQRAKKKHTDQPNHPKRPIKQACKSGAHQPQREVGRQRAARFRPELLARMHGSSPAWERDDRADSAGAREAPPCPGRPTSRSSRLHSSLQPRSRARGRPSRQVPTFLPLGGAAPPGPPPREGQGGWGRDGARGAGGSRGWPGTRASAEQDAPAAQPRRAAAPLGFPGSAHSPRGDPGPTTPRVRRREWRGRGSRAPVT